LTVPSLFRCNRSLTSLVRWTAIADYLHPIGKFDPLPAKIIHLLHRPPNPLSTYSRQIRTFIKITEAPTNLQVEISCKSAGAFACLLTVGGSADGDMSASGWHSEQELSIFYYFM